MDIFDRTGTIPGLLVASTLVEPARLEVSGDVSSTPKAFQPGGRLRPVPCPFSGPSPKSEANREARDTSRQAASTLRIARVESGADHRAGRDVRSLLGWVGLAAMPPNGWGRPRHLR